MFDRCMVHAYTETRTRALSCTAEGKRVAEAMLADRADSLRPVLAVLEPEEREQLERLLGRVTAGLADDRPGALLTCRLCDRGSCQGDARHCPLNDTVSSG